jgi:hypothetical protein
VSPQVKLMRRSARRRAGTLAIELVQEIRRLIAADALASRPAQDGSCRVAAARSRRRIRNMVIHLHEALNFGLDFEFAPEPDLSAQQAHARNLAAVVRRSTDAALGTGAIATVESGQLLQAARYAEELVGTIKWLQERTAGLERETPAQPWSSTWSGRVLGIVARLLPSDQRREFIEDQCGNLDWTESRRERFEYLIGLLVRMPAVAAAALASRFEEDSAAIG